MAIDLNDEILQDFLVEAGEILELLGEQLVELEQAPDDLDLLNAVFRGFHTVKGGGGFLSLNTLVEVCHRAEDVFNLLRQGERQVTPQLMDVILQVTDVVNDMMDSIRSGVDPDAADPALLQALEAILKGEEVAEVAAEPAAAEPVVDVEPVVEAEPVAEAVAEPEAASPASSDDITDDEFEALLDDLHGKATESPAPAEAAAPASDSDEITEDEFEALLDQLHSSTPQQDAGAVAESPASAPETSEPVAADNSSDEITDDEFESLLDDLETKKKAAPAAEAIAAKPVSAPEPAPQAKPEPTPEPAAKPEPAPEPKAAAKAAPAKAKKQEAKSGEKDDKKEKEEPKKE